MKLSMILATAAAAALTIASPAQAAPGPDARRAAELRYTDCLIETTMQVWARSHDYNQTAYRATDVCYRILRSERVLDEQKKLELVRMAPELISITVQHQR